MFRRFAAAAVLGLLFLAPAQAAPTYNWSGFYIGVNAGGGMANGAFTDDCYFCATDAFDDGFAVAGGQLGFNWQNGAAVFGLVGDFDWTSLDRSGLLGADDQDILHESFKLSWLATIRARAGLTIDRALLFVSAGPAFGHIDAPGVEFCCSLPGTPDGNFFSSEGTRTGLVGGFGFEWAMDGGWSISGEYLYFDLGEETAELTGVDAASCDPKECTVQNTLSGQLVRFSANWHFGT